jgi:lysophospholipase L1-like esterase
MGTEYASPWPPDGTARFAFHSFLMLWLSAVFLSLILPRVIHRFAPGLSARLEWTGRAPWSFLRILGSVVLFFLLWEYLITVYTTSAIIGNPLYTQSRPHPILVWLLTPGVHDDGAGLTVSVNSQGLRERELPLEKEPGEYRIFMAGDSNTFGTGIAPEDTAPRQLEQRLRELYPRRKITVINGGIYGYTVPQGYFLFREVGLKYHPDLLIVNELSDLLKNRFFREGNNPYRYGFQMMSKYHSSPILFEMQLALAKVNFYTVLRNEVLRLTASAPANLQASGDPASLEEYNHAQRVFYMDQFIRLCRVKGVSAIFANLVLGPTGEIESKKNGNVRIITLHLMTAQWKAERSNTLPADPGHFNRKGNRIVSDAFAEVIRREELIR